MALRRAIATVGLAFLAACRADRTPAPAPTPTAAVHGSPHTRQEDPFEAWLRAAVAAGSLPRDEPALMLVSTTLKRMRVRVRGEHLGDFEVAFGQEEGQKRRQGDLRTPLGTYFVVAKSRGPFAGPYAGYYGGHWIKLNYPNADDAVWGRTEGLLTADTAARITDAWQLRRPTAQDTPLGGGIGFHGWADDWDLDGPRRLSWGCVVMRNEDIARLFDRVPIGAAVVIF